MKKIKFFLLICAISLCVFSVSAQRRFNGQVIEVKDGKTFVVQLQNKSLVTVVLQFIEVPEPTQQMRQIVKTHLEGLILGKSVEVNPKGISNAKTIGQIFINGTDVSQQMLRDGAAWYALPEKSGQEVGERTIYQQNEAQAKQEKRGVWSIADLKPTWEFRAEIEEQKRLAERKRFEEEKARLAEIKAKETAPEKSPAEKRNVATSANSKLLVELWSDPKDSSNKSIVEYEGIYSGYDSDEDAYYFHTRPYVTILESGNENKQLVNIMVAYLYKGEVSKPVDGKYLFRFFTASDKRRVFQTSNSLNIYVNGQKLNFGKPIRLEENVKDVVAETLLYDITRSQLDKIAKAKTSKIQIGTYSWTIDKFLKDHISRLLEATK